MWVVPTDCIDKSKIDGVYRSGNDNQFYIHLDIAKAFNLVIPKTGPATSDDLGYQLTSLVSAEHVRDPIRSVLFKGDDQVLWQINDADQIGFKPEGIASQSKFSRLRSSVNWSFYELGHYFQSPLHQK